MCVVYFLRGGDFPPHAGELHFSALVLLGQHHLHLLQVGISPRHTVHLIHPLLVDLLRKPPDWHRQTFRDLQLQSYTTLCDATARTNRKIFDLIAPEGQSTSTDVHNYIWSQTGQHHGFVLLRGRQLRPHDVQLPRQRRGAGRADGRGAAELNGPVRITENMGASCDPGEATQLDPTLREVAQEGVIADRHGHNCGEYSHLVMVQKAKQ